MLAAEDALRKFGADEIVFAGDDDEALLDEGRASASRYAGRSQKRVKLRYRTRAARSRRGTRTLALAVETQPSRS